LKTDFGGLPIAFHLTGGEASDSRNFETLLDIGPDINPRAALGDKGYDSKSNRDASRQRGICPAIPYRSNTKAVPAFFPKVLYKGRARIEQTVGKLKRFKRIALRCEKTVARAAPLTLTQSWPAPMPGISRPNWKLRSGKFGSATGLATQRWRTKFCSAHQRKPIFGRQPEQKLARSGPLTPKLS
jgi:transposase